MTSLLQERRITLLLGFLLVAAVFAIDTLTTIGGAIAVLYVLALLILAPSLDIRQVVAAALLCIGLTLTSFVIAHSGHWAADAMMRCAIAVLAIATATLLLIRGKRDSLALHKAQQELAAISQLAMLGELMASIAHEVNQPLAGVVANGEAALRWMRRTPPDLGEVDQAVRRMIADGRRASAVVSRVRGIAGRGAAMEPRDFDLNIAIEETLQLLRGELAVHGLHIERALAAKLPPVAGDRIQIQQVLANLLLNAIQAVDEDDGRIRIRSGRDGALATIEITDNGKGVPPEVADRLFDAFVTTKPSAMGMGLSVCRTIIEAHGGTISEAPAEGRGAAFRITLPLSDKQRRER